MSKADKALVKQTTPKEIEDEVNKYGLISPYSKENVLARGLEALKKETKRGPLALTEDSPIMQLISLRELESGNLLAIGFPELYRALVTDLSRQFQEEFGCISPSDKATAHLAAQNYVRLLELQRNINGILSAQEYRDLKLKRLAILNKAYDQANRQYLLTIQALRVKNQPPVYLTVKAQSANVAAQQLVQEKNEIKAK